MALRQPVVVGTDFTPSSKIALERASALAAQSNRPLCLAHIIPDVAQVVDTGASVAWAAPSAPDGPKPRRAAVRSAGVAADETPIDTKHYLGALKAAAEKSKVKPKTKVRVGSPYEQLVAVAEEEDALLIVTGVRPAKNPLERYIIGSTAERVLRSGKRPVLLARRKATSPYRKIYVPVDLSDQALRVLVFVRDLFPSAKLCLANFLPREKGKKAADKKSDIVARQELLGRLVAAAGLDPATTALDVKHHDPREGILEGASDWGADLIAMGTHSRSGVSRLLLGSIAEHIFRAALVDVLAIPPNVG